MLVLHETNLNTTVSAIRLFVELNVFTANKMFDGERSNFYHHEVWHKKLLKSLIGSQNLVQQYLVAYDYKLTDETHHLIKNLLVNKKGKVWKRKHNLVHWYFVIICYKLSACLLPSTNQMSLYRDARLNISPSLGKMDVYASVRLV